MNSKRKGNSGEKELLTILQAAGIEAHRNDQTFVGGKDNPDIACSVGGVSFHVECKRTEKLSLYEAMEQAERDAAVDSVPVVVHRRSRKPWLVVVPLQYVLALSTKK